jgi:phage N-6-adenine-methyltransferase
MTDKGGKVKFCEPKPKSSTIETPQELFAPLNAEFHFTRDVCATHENKKVSAYWSVDDDGLAQEWSGMLWMNPPYGKDCGLWVKKAYDAACSGAATVVCLLPVRSNNDWWKWCIQGEIRFLRYKWAFVGMKHDAMFPSAIVIFHAHLDPGGIMKIWNPKDSQ